MSIHVFNDDKLKYSGYWLRETNFKTKNLDFIIFELNSY